ISFRGHGRQIDSLTSENGQYSVQLPPGTYQAAIEVPGMCPLLRSSFRVRADRAASLNLYLLQCGIADYVVMTGERKGSMGARWVPAHDDESFPVRSRSGELPLSIRYAERHLEGSAYRYLSAGKSGTANRVQVLITYDLVTIQAERAVFDKKAPELCAQGNVLLEDGSQNSHLSAVRLRFHDGEPVLQAVERCTP
ncbi:MAG TPA: carboxypeptidase-like regulatory domain-containing protein, partial [Terriglobales bacterium]|nr:carboxypeptidase-like regulatory domain-containing protein [Terriglobales bacterium]